jgi:gliding motility-associated-like protein
MLFMGFAYKYFDLWQTPSKVERNCPDLYGSGADCGARGELCYIRSAEWTTSVDIHKGVSKEDVDLCVADEDADAWKYQFSPYVPSPYYSARYTIKVTNYFGQTDTMSTGVIEARAAKAQLKMFILKGENDRQDWVEKNDDSSEESPAAIRLVNTSINSESSASTFTWSLFSNLYEQPDDVLPEDVPLIAQVVTRDSAEVVENTYQPGKYPIALFVRNKYECFNSDTVLLEIDEFLLNKDAIPTVFTPNGDGKNDEFKLKDPDNNAQSLQSIEINIFNRYGQLMYSSKDVLFSWNGKMRNTNTVAPDGVYFYVIKATGFSKKREKITQVYKGSFHLFGSYGR